VALVRCSQTRVWRPKLTTNLRSCFCVIARPLRHAFLSAQWAHSLSVATRNFRMSIGCQPWQSTVYITQRLDRLIPDPYVHHFVRLLLNMYLALLCGFTIH
jgi:hypothetical protein